jgi:integrase
MNYLLHIKGNYYYLRRVPTYLKAYDPRQEIRVSLFTDSRKEAARLAALKNEEVEAYWKQLITEKRTHCPQTFKTIHRQSRLARFTGGFSLPTLPAAIPDQHKPDAPAPVSIEEGLELFWGFARNKTMNKTPNQLRKWRNPRRTAIRNLINCIGNKPMQDVTRGDVLKFRDWWIDRIQEEGLGANAANKNFIQTKVIFETVSDNLGLNLDIKGLFQKLILEENDENRRLPLESEYIRNVLLNPDNLKGLRDQEKYVLYAIAETGAGISEHLSLLPEDIHLDCDVPHIEIKPRHKSSLKTRYRKRIIPLVGYALEAFKACPQGFTDYRDRPDRLSGVLNRYLRENNLLPTENHSVYSLRHSFQDRLLAVNTPDRIQADLMGHKFHRPRYGDGATLSHKLEWMKKIELKQNQ